MHVFIQAAHNVRNAINMTYAILLTQPLCKLVKMLQIFRLTYAASTLCGNRKFNLIYASEVLCAEISISAELKALIKIFNPLVV